MEVWKPPCNLHTNNWQSKKEKSADTRCREVSVKFTICSSLSVTLIPIFRTITLLATDIGATLMDTIQYRAVHFKFSKRYLAQGTCLDCTLSIELCLSPCLPDSLSTWHLYSFLSTRSCMCFRLLCYMTIVVRDHLYSSGETKSGFSPCGPQCPVYVCIYIYYTSIPSIRTPYIFLAKIAFHWEKYSVKIIHRVVTLLSVNSHALQTNQVTLADDSLHFS